MAKSKKLQMNATLPDRRASLRKISSRGTKVSGHAHGDKRSMKPSEKREWQNAVCSVCMESPHNAVLLLCSSYEKGCRPYMCATSHRFSNCLEQYKRAYTKSSSDAIMSDKFGGQKGKTEKSELLCPLCRGEVMGWTVVDPARRYLNAKKRSCMQENCSFVGTYKKLKKHVKLVHPMAPRPRDVDPLHAEKWKKLENERDMSDVLSTIQSTTPGAVVVGDYVIERNFRDPFDHREDDYSHSEDDYSSDDGFFRFVGRWSDPQLGGSGIDYDSFDEYAGIGFGGVRGRATLASRSTGTRAISARPRTRLLGRRRTGRLRTGR